MNVFQNHLPFHETQINNPFLIQLSQSIISKLIYWPHLWNIQNYPNNKNGIRIPYTSEFPQDINTYTDTHNIIIKFEDFVCIKDISIKVSDDTGCNENNFNLYGLENDKWKIICLGITYTYPHDLISNKIPLGHLCITYLYLLKFTLFVNSKTVIKCLDLGNVPR